MKTLNLAIYISEGINLLIVIYGLIYIIQRVTRLRRLSYSNRSIHINPKYRWAFVIIFILVNLAELILFFVKILNQNEIDYWLPQLLMTIGTFFNSLIMIGGLFLLKLQITKDRKRTKLHFVYSIYLILITTMRLSEQIWTFLDKGSLDFQGQIISDAVLLALTIFMLVYKLMNRKFEDYLGQDVGINELQERLRKGSMTFTEQNIQNVDGFPYLKVDVQGLTEKSISFAVFLKQKPFTIMNVSIQNLHDFHLKTQILDIHNRLNIQKDLDVNDIQDFVDELLSSWQNYQVFVLEFFGVPFHMHYQWSRMIEKIKQQSNLSQQFDSNSIFFSLSIPRLIKYYNNFQLLIQIQTRSGKFKKQANKTIKQIKQLHQKLSSIKIVSRKLTFSLRLPTLPEMSTQIKEEGVIEQKRKQYEKYFQRIVNDRNIIKRYQQVRIIIYEFFGYNESIQLSLRKQSSIDYKGMYSRKIRIKTKLNSKNQPIVLYYFEIKKYEEYFKRIKKSYNDFVELDQEIKRYLYNSQTQKFVELAELPPKPTHFLNPIEKQDMHASLNLYFNVFLSAFPDISQIYEFKVFLNIRSQEEETEDTQSFFQMPESPPSFDKKLSQFSLEKSNSIMQDELLSQKIDNLGNSEFDMEIQ